MRPVTLGPVLLPAGEPLDQEESGRHHLEDDGEREEGDEENLEWRAELQGVTELVGVGREQSDVHQTLGYGNLDLKFNVLENMSEKLM